MDVKARLSKNLDKAVPEGLVGLHGQCTYHCLELAPGACFGAPYLCLMIALSSSAVEQGRLPKIGLGLDWRGAGVLLNAPNTGKKAAQYWGIKQHLHGLVSLGMSISLCALAQGGILSRLRQGGRLLSSFCDKRFDPVSLCMLYSTLRLCLNVNGRTSTFPSCSFSLTR